MSISLERIVAETLLAKLSACSDIIINYPTYYDSDDSSLVIKATRIRAGDKFYAISYCTLSSIRIIELTPALRYRSCTVNFDLHDPTVFDRGATTIAQTLWPARIF